MSSSQPFLPVNPQVQIPAVENEVLAFWKQENIFYKSLEIRKNSPAFVFYDGPPFATGLPHYGHLLASTIKDIVPRYWTMQGYYVERRFGWDCHGLPVENEMEKELNLSGRPDIEKLGLHLFNEACRSIVLRYTNQWQQVIDRIGRWVDFNNQYRTMDSTYMESIWWAFKQIWQSGLVYQGFRVQPYCPRCSTPLSNFELNEGYKEAQSPSITVTFPLADDPQTKILVWTTTPWTLPSNSALAVSSKIQYALIQDGADRFIIAKERLHAYYHDSNKYVILDEFNGSRLAGRRYQPIFNYFVSRSEKLFQITTADFVTTTDGTGIVHIAPAFGEDDFQVGLKLELPVLCPVDAEGKFTEEVPQWKGMVVFDADSQIITHLKQAGRLIHRSTIEHRYPFCYRCDTALIYKAIDTWFIRIEPLRETMLQSNQRIHWVPDHLQNGRFGKGIESAPDWNVSRNRFWGTPIPVWLCPACDHRLCIGSIDELHTLFGNGDQAKGQQIHDQAIAAVHDKIKSEAAEKFKEFNIDSQWQKRLGNIQLDRN
ncbi:MAG: class I tRNA ligase family protein, partial [Chitinivibrionales bacterium]|nr:class I tRNA ligase family protein [Chitinivibrionales bacterium]